MFYIVETRQQLLNLHCSGDECYVNIIPLNDNYHSSLSSPSLIYFRTPKGKGYIFPINHSEGFSLELDDVLEWISKYSTIYTLNKKECLYYFPTSKLVDVNPMEPSQIVVMYFAIGVIAFTLLDLTLILLSQSRNTLKNKKKSLTKSRINLKDPQINFITRHSLKSSKQ
jgi:hypothetical protein